MPCCGPSIISNTWCARHTHPYPCQRIRQELPSQYRKELLDSTALPLWSALDVEDWLRHQNMEQYVPQFRARGIDGYALSTLTPEDLEIVGVATSAHRSLIMNSILRLLGAKTARAIDLWTAKEVCKWLEHSNLQKLVPLFDKCNVTGDELLELNSGDLFQLGVHSRSLRSHFLLARNKLFHLPSGRVEIAQWRVAEVGSWLQHVGMHDYRPLFETAAVTGKVLLGLDAAGLEALGLSNRAHRTILLNRIETLRKEVDIGTPISGDPSQWDALDVQQWLQQLQLGHLKSQFNQSQVDGPALVSLLTADAEHPAEVELATLVANPQEMELLLFELRLLTSQLDPAAPVDPLHRLSKRSLVADGATTADVLHAVPVWLKCNLCKLTLLCSPSMQRRAPM